MLSEIPYWYPLNGRTPKKPNNKAIPAKNNNPYKTTLYMVIPSKKRSKKVNI
jgi:hypothetical protein